MAQQKLSDTMKDANEKYGGGGTSDFYKMAEGDNHFRILTPFTTYGEHYQNNPSKYNGVCVGKEEGCQGCAEGHKPTAKWLAWVWYRGSRSRNETPGLRLLKVGWKIVKPLAAYQDSEEYKFTDFPMPYDVNIKADGAGTTNVVYTVIPARKETPVPEGVEKELAKKRTPEQIVEAMKEKKTKKEEVEPEEARSAGIDYPTEEINPDDIPF